MSAGRLLALPALASSSSAAARLVHCRGPVGGSSAVIHDEVKAKLFSGHLRLPSRPSRTSEVGRRGTTRHAVRELGHAAWTSSVDGTAGGGTLKSDGGPFSIPEFQVIKVNAAPGVPPEPSRLDAYLTANIPEVSRGRIVSSIKEGLVDVNGKLIKKPAYKVGAGDAIVCRIQPLPPMEAFPEDIPLDVAYEDEHLMIVNKPAGMVVHPSAGHSSGTLVNAVLHHCRLPPMRVVSGRQHGESVIEEEDEEDGWRPRLDQEHDHPDALAASHSSQQRILRPGIVHRLDKGTSGLIVVAKDGLTHAGLCEQFAARTVRRRYLAIVLGMPNPDSGRVNAPIGRDPKDRLKMAIVNGSTGRPAASNYKVRASLAGGNAALVEWRLETGRTHQIRVHTREIGHPILGDDTYNGGGGMAAERLHRRGIMELGAAQRIVKNCNRPLLHARTLGFQHPVTGEQLDFAADPPADFEAAFDALSI